MYDGLPDNANSRREDPLEPHWGTHEELMAQLIEEVSVLVADKRRKDPRTLPRPWEKSATAGPAEGVHHNPDGGVTAVGLGGMLSVTQMRGAVSL